MFGFGGISELVFILFLAMLIFGPEKLPEISRMVAKGLAEVRKASNELKRTLNAELAISEQEAEARRQAATHALVPTLPDGAPLEPFPPLPASSATPNLTSADTFAGTAAAASIEMVPGEGTGTSPWTAAPDDFPAAFAPAPAPPVPPSPSGLFEARPEWTPSAPQLRPAARAVPTAAPGTAAGFRAAAASPRPGGSAIAAGDEPVFLMTPYGVTQDAYPTELARVERVEAAAGAPGAEADRSSTR